MKATKGELRRAALLELLKREGKLSVKEMVEATRSSEATVRRDLDALEKSGRILRTIGGAVYEGTMAQISVEKSFADKRPFLREEKERIAEAAASLVREGDVVGLTGGTTTYFIARALRRRTGITVVTNAVNIAMELAEADGVQVVLVGGVMRAKSYELIGPLAESVVEKLNISKMFLGVDGLSPEHGFTTHAELEASVARLMIGRSTQVYAVFDHSKFHRSALFTIVPLGGVTGVVVDREPEAALRQLCEAERVEMHWPGGDGGAPRQAEPGRPGRVGTLHQAEPGGPSGKESSDGAEGPGSDAIRGGTGGDGNQL